MSTMQPRPPFIEIDGERVICTPEATVVVLEVYVEDEEARFIYGCARRCPGDKHDQATALYLAHGRAYEKLAHLLLKRGNGLVKHHDDIRAAKRESRHARDAAKGSRPVDQPTPVYPPVHTISNIEEDAARHGG